MGTKYIFLDIDGTLVGKDAVIPESAKRAIQKARENGHKVFIGSGRSRCEMHEGILNIELDGIVGSAGAYVEIDGKMIYHRPMSEQMNAELLDYFESKQMDIMIETNDDLLVNQGAGKAIREHIRYCNENNLTYDKGLFDLARPLEDIEEPAKLPINKILYVNSLYDDEEIRNDLQDKYTVVQSAIGLMGNSGELSELGMHKGNGIRVVADYFGADMADTIAIGDGENDMEMLKSAKVGIAMGNAVQMLKDIADYVTTDVDKDGIENAFRQYGLI